MFFSLCVSDGANRLSSKASLASTTSRFNLSSRWNLTRNAPRLYLSRSMTSNAGYTEVSENDTAPRTYTWPDNKVHTSLERFYEISKFPLRIPQLNECKSSLFAEAKGVHFRWRVWRIVHSFEIRIACVA